VRENVVVSSNERGQNIHPSMICNRLFHSESWRMELSLRQADERYNKMKPKRQIAHVLTHRYVRKGMLTFKNQSQRNIFRDFPKY